MFGKLTSFFPLSPRKSQEPPQQTELRSMLGKPESNLPACMDFNRPKTQEMIDRLSLLNTECGAKDLDQIEILKNLITGIQRDLNASLASSTDDVVLQQQAVFDKYYVPWIQNKALKRKDDWQKQGQELLIDVIAAATRRRKDRLWKSENTRTISNVLSQIDAQFINVTQVFDPKKPATPSNQTTMRGFYDLISKNRTGFFEIRSPYEHVIMHYSYVNGVPRITGFLSDVKNGRLLEGEFVEASESGFFLISGRITYCNTQIVFETETIRDLQTEIFRGTATYPNGDVYKGQWQHQPMGAGIFYYADDVIKISIQSDNFFGYTKVGSFDPYCTTGLIRYKNGDSYLGPIDNNPDKSVLGIANTIEKDNAITPFMVLKGKKALYRGPLDASGHFHADGFVTYYDGLEYLDSGADFRALGLQTVSVNDRLQLGVKPREGLFSYSGTFHESNSLKTGRLAVPSKDPKMHPMQASVLLGRVYFKSALNFVNRKTEVIALKERFEVIGLKHDLD